MQRRFHVHRPVVLMVFHALPESFGNVRVLQTAQEPLQGFALRRGRFADGCLDDIGAFPDGKRYHFFDESGRWHDLSKSQFLA